MAFKNSLKIILMLFYFSISCNHQKINKEDLYGKWYFLENQKTPLEFWLSSKYIYSSEQDCFSSALTYKITDNDSLIICPELTTFPHFYAKYHLKKVDKNKYMLELDNIGFTISRFDKNEPNIDTTSEFRDSACKEYLKRRNDWVKNKRGYNEYK